MQSDLHKPTVLSHFVFQEIPICNIQDTVIFSHIPDCRFVATLNLHQKYYIRMYGLGSLWVSLSLNKQTVWLPTYPLPPSLPPNHQLPYM